MNGDRRGGMIEIGWRELVALPDLGIGLLQAKIDTGARTSALHAVDLHTFEKGGVLWIEFTVPASGGKPDARCMAHVVDEREIKNTGGVSERRYVVETRLVLGNRRWRVEVSLTDREHMEFDLILGRTAVRRRRLLINPSKSNLAGPPGFRAEKRTRSSHPV